MANTFPTIDENIRLFFRSLKPPTILEANDLAVTIFQLNSGMSVAHIVLGPETA